MKQIQLTKGKTTTVDDADYEWLSQFSWHCHSGGYAATKIKQRVVLMHRLIMDTPEGMDTDHMNRDKLDNRRSNLRVCTHAENMKNRKMPKAYVTNSSGSGGIMWESRRGKWVVRIQIQRQRKYYGQYSTKDEALAAAKLVRQGV